MGNYNTRSVNFLQTPSDFPCPVTLGKNTPSFGLCRFNKALRFVPPDNEGFTLRGDKRQLVYKGRRRSHRFTILGDSAFEYDCILEKEPESNVVSLVMEGAEHFDFYRQPDFVPDDFLKGSYAVYKKETLIGQGTGKLCHIHRPLIIDARGRKVWGDLSVVGNELRITIPQDWLANAKYPVVVDPTVGTTAVGSQTTWNSDPPEPWSPLCFECSIPVNRFLISEKLEGNCTAYFYTHWDDWDAGGRPVFYSNNNNQPHLRRSASENWVNLRVVSGNPAGWRSATFRTNEAIPAGTNIWFGLFAEYFWLPRFDYGAVFWESWWYDDVIPNTYPDYRNQNVPNSSYTFKPSMYFTYVSAQNHVRTLTQGVRLTDARSLKADYKRLSTQTTRINDNRILTANYKRDTFQNVNTSTVAKPLFTFIRHCLVTVSNVTGLSRKPVFSRLVNDEVKSLTVTNEKMEINRKCDDIAIFYDDVNRSQGFIRSVINNVKTNDNNSYSILFLRTVNETQGVTDTFHRGWNFIRRLYVEAGSIAETERQGNYHRIESDAVYADGSVFRHLIIFIKLVSTSIIRDFILRRFLIAREQLVLKSCITRELTFESKIN